jgi:hypothetical protein
MHFLAGTTALTQGASGAGEMEYSGIFSSGRIVNIHRKIAAQTLSSQRAASALVMTNS